jgi:hypothetical protein
MPVCDWIKKLHEVSVIDCIPSKYTLGKIGVVVGPVGPLGPVGPAGPQYVLFNCRWPIKITVKIRAFFEKMAGGIPETKFCNFKIFF